MDVLIKRLKENNWQELRTIRLRALQSDPAVFGSNYQKESTMTEADWRNWLQTEDGAIFMLYANTAPIGMTAIAVDRDDPMKKTAILWGSWLEPHARGKGLSEIMYRERIAWAKKHPTIERIIVAHRASNVRSKSANQKHGFLFTHTVDKVWPDGTHDGNIFYELRVKHPSHPES